MISFSKANPLYDLLNPSMLKPTQEIKKPRKRKSTLGERKEHEMSRETVDRITFDEMRLVYEKNTWVRACIDKIVTRLALIPPKLYPIEQANSKHNNTPASYKPTDEQLRHIEEVAEFLINPNSSRESFGSIRQKIDRDLLMYDAGSIEIVRGESGLPAEMFAMEGSSIMLSTDQSGNFTDYKKAYFERIEEDPTGLWYGIDELIYLVMNPRSGTPYGTSKIETLARTVINAHKIENYNADLFGNDATPRLAVLFNNVSLDKLQEYQEYWDSNLRGKPHRPILISTGEGEGQVKIEKIGLSPNEMSFKQYSQWMLEQIMSVFNMQPLVLGMVTPNTGKLNSEQQQEQFERDALVPQLNTFAYHFNSELIWSMANPLMGHKGGFGYKDIYLDWGLQRELNEQEQWELDKEALAQGVLTPNWIRKERYGLPPVRWGNIPMKIAIKQGVPTGLEELELTEWKDINEQAQAMSEINPFVDLGAETEVSPPEPEETEPKTPDEREPKDEQLDGDNTLRDNDTPKTWEASLEGLKDIPGIGNTTIKKIENYFKKIDKNDL